MNRSVQEVKARCASILGNMKILSLVEASSSATAAYDMVFAETHNVDTAKAGRWLAVLRRDFPQEYSALITSTPVTSANDKARLGELQ